MKRVSLFISAVLLFVVALLGISSPAMASEGPVTPQKICNSSGSFKGSVIEQEFRRLPAIYRGNCRDYPYSTRIHEDGRSFRVAYDYGDYQGCQSTPDGKVFTPTTKHSVIYIKTYTGTNC